MPHNNEIKKFLGIDIRDVWNIQNKEDFLIAVNSWLCRKSDNGSNLPILSTPERTVYLTLQLEAEVNNGGFIQYFYNAYGDISADMTREHIIKYFIREIILYNDCLVITYNFTDKHILKKTIPDDISEVEKALNSLSDPMDFPAPCLYKQASSPPIKSRTERMCSVRDFSLMLFRFLPPSIAPLKSLSAIIQLKFINTCSIINV